MTVQAPGAFGRPAGQTLVTGTNISKAVYIQAKPLATLITGFLYEAFNNSGVGQPVKIIRFGLSGGNWVQVGSDVSVVVPANAAGVPVPVAVAITANAGERLGFEPQNAGAFTFVAAMAGDEGGYYTIAFSLRSGAQGSLTTSNQLQHRLSYNYPAVTGPDYLVTKSRLLAAETGKVGVDALRLGKRSLDFYAKPFGAVGLVRLTMNYGGPLVRLRRSTDNAEADFGCATGSDLLDVTAVTAWLGGGTGFAKTLYDQFGVNDITQTTTLVQPTLVISGANAWLSFATAKWMPVAGAWLNLARYKDAVHIGFTARMSALPATDSSAFYLSQSSSTTLVKVSVTFATTGSVYGRAQTYDGSNGNTGIQSPVIGAGVWFGSLYSANFRGADSRIIAGGADTPSPLVLREATKSEDLAGMGAALGAGTGGSSPVPMDLVAFVAWDVALTNAERAAIQIALSTFAPGYTAPAVPAKVWVYADSQGNSSQIPDYTKRFSPMLAEAMATASGTYRVVRNKGVDGNTSTQIATRFLADVAGISANDAVIVIAGRNDAIHNAPDSTTRDSRIATAIANLQSMYDAMPAGHHILFGLPPFTIEEITGNTGRNNMATYHAAIISTFPGNYYDLATPMATYGGNATGGSASALIILPDAPLHIHPNELGISAVYVPTTRAALAAKGWPS